VLLLALQTSLHMAVRCGSMACKEDFTEPRVSVWRVRRV
jgi:hypothetical protein